MTGPEDAIHTEITEDEWMVMSDEARNAVIAEGAWEIIDAWAVAVEEP